MVQTLYNNYLMILKLIWVIWITSEKQWKVQKAEIQCALHLSKKCIPSAKTLHAEDLCNIAFDYCENSQNSLCHFENLKSFFTTQLACIFLGQTLHTFGKNIPCKFKSSDFPLLELKFTKFLMSLFEQKVSFSSKLGSLFSVMRHKSSSLF